MRIFVGGMNSETNTFSPVPTGLSDFQIGYINSDTSELPNECLLLRHLKQCIEERGWQCVPSFIAVAEPSGVTTRRAYETLKHELLNDLKHAMPVDMVLLPLHGAMVAEGCDDCEADLTQAVRQQVGQDVSVGVLLDLHCHVSDALVNAADLIAMYREYPHTDILQRAEALLDMTADKAQGRTKPVMATFDCRIVNLYPTSLEPMRSLVGHLAEMDQRPGIISADIGHGFPWGDVEECGTKTLVISDNHPLLAEQAARELGLKLYALRDQLQFRPLPMSEAYDQALANNKSKRPVVIADVADNAGGGAPCDSTFALSALLDRKPDSPCALGMIYDPQVVDIAMKAGQNAHLKVRLGGKTSVASGSPLDLDVEVVGTVPTLIQHFPQDGGDPIPVPCGDTVCLKQGNVFMVVNSVRTQVFSPSVFTDFGVSLEQVSLLIVKSTFHFYAAFHPVASNVLLMTTPSALNTSFTEVPYQKASTDQYPWLKDPLGIDAADEP